MTTDPTITRLENELKRLQEDMNRINEDIRHTDMDYQARLRKLGDDHLRQSDDLRFKLNRLVRDQGDKNRELDRARAKVHEEEERKRREEANQKGSKFERTKLRPGD